MCLICIEFEKGNITATEALRNAVEIARGNTDLKHLAEVLSRVMPHLEEGDEEIVIDPENKDE